AEIELRRLARRSPARDRVAVRELGQVTPREREHRALAPRRELVDEEGRDRDRRRGREERTGAELSHESQRRSRRPHARELFAEIPVETRERERRELGRRRVRADEARDARLIVHARGAIGARLEVSLNVALGRRVELAVEERGEEREPAFAL